MGDTQQRESSLRGPEPAFRMAPNCPSRSLTKGAFPVALACAARCRLIRSGRFQRIAEYVGDPALLFKTYLRAPGGVGGGWDLCLAQPHPASGERLEVIKCDRSSLCNGRFWRGSPLAPVLPLAQGQG